MTEQASNLELFSHIRVLISLIVGLSLTRLLSGVARIIQHPGGKPVYWVHLSWVAWMFVGAVNFWWWESRLVQLERWEFAYYLFLILYATSYFLPCVLLFPDQMDEYAGYRDYFMSRRAWFFGLFALQFLLDVGDTLLKGQAYLHGLGIEYPVRAIAFVLLCIVAARTTSPRFHAAFVVCALVYELSWIWRRYELIS